MTLSKLVAVLILGMIVLVIGTVYAQSREQVYSIEIQCDDRNCIIAKRDVQVMANYIVKLERECAAKSF